jgi:capsular exopolysaccharide synthesis family protein
MVEQAQADPVIAGMTREMSALKVDELSMKQQGLGDGHLACISLRNRYKATQARYNDELKIVLQRIHDSNVEGYAKSEESLAAREKKLEDELKTTTDRKRDLLAITGKIDQIDNQMIELTAELQRVNASRENLELLSNNAVFDQVRVMIPAQTPSSVSFPKLMMMLPLGVLLVTGLTAGVVLLREIMDQRVKGPADVAMIPRLRVLGMIPDAAEDPARPGSVETAFRDTPGGVVTESFRQVRAPLVKKMDTEGHRTVLVLAGMPGSGATTVACNLAIGCAAADDRVLIIDANVRRPAMGRIFGLSDPLGLADCLAGQTTLAEAVRPTSVPNLSVLVAGSPGNRMAPERLSSESMSRLLAEAAAGFDRVFIDCPPAIVSGDGLALANRCDAVVMVVRAMNEKRGLVNRVRMQLSESRAELIGVIVNAVKSSAGGYFKRNIQATHEYHNPAKA